MSDTVSVGEYARAAHTLSIRVVVIERERRRKRLMAHSCLWLVGEDAAADDRALIGREEEMRGHRLCGFGDFSKRGDSGQLL